MKTEAQKLIMNAYKLGGKEYKDKLEQAFPELFKPFKNGDWIKCITTDAFLLKIDLEKSSDYGFYFGDWQGELSDRNFNPHPDFWQKATEAEVIAAFEKEFEKRGFKEGVKFKSVFSENINKFSGLYFENFFNEKMLETYGQQIFSNGWVIYKDGVFAEIVEEPKTIEQRLEIVEQFINEFKNQ